MLGKDIIKYINKSYTPSVFELQIEKLKEVEDKIIYEREYQVGPELEWVTYPRIVQVIEEGWIEEKMRDLI